MHTQSSEFFEAGGPSDSPRKRSNGDGRIPLKPESETCPSRQVTVVGIRPIVVGIQPDVATRTIGTKTKKSCFITIWMTQVSYFSFILIKMI